MSLFTMKPYLKYLLSGIILITILTLAILMRDTPEKHMAKFKNFIETGNKVNALEELNIAIRLNPREKDYYYLRGLLNLDMNNMRLAYQDFGVACAEGNGNLEACNIHMYMKTGINFKERFGRTF